MIPSVAISVTWPSHRGNDRSAISTKPCDPLKPDPAGPADRGVRWILVYPSRVVRTSLGLPGSGQASG